MGTSRRTFLWQSVAAASTFGWPAACSQNTGTPSTATSQVVDTPTLDFEPSYIRLNGDGELERREAILWNSLAECEGCARACGADRLGGEVGVCSSTDRLVVHSMGAHGCRALEYWERPSVIVCHVSPLHDSWDRGRWPTQDLRL